MKTVSTESISPWLQMLWDEGGSDLLLTGGSPPRLRVDGKLRPIAGAGEMRGEDVDEIVRSLLDPSQVRDLRRALGRRLLLLLAGQGPTQGERLHAEGSDGAGASDDPHQDPDV